MTRPTFYRHRDGDDERENKRRPAPHRALSQAERTHVLGLLHEMRFVDKAPRQVYATLLDEGVYVCSVSTMYRILRANDEVRERRKLARHPERTKPQLRATGPNQVWSWDITKLRGVSERYNLYVMLDIYSRYVVGWTVEREENATLAKHFISRTCERQGVDTSKLTIHSDRGSPMTSQTVAQLLADLGVTKSLSRPRVSNDNCFSEAHFKTLKYCPPFPEEFGSIQDARRFLRWFFDWYNNEHYHTGIALMTPATVHFGLADDCTKVRAAVLSEAFNAHPERFVKGPSKPLTLSEATWINPPEEIVAPGSKTAA
jgi:putative transposase